MKIKNVNQLEGQALDWAVAKALGYNPILKPLKNDVGFALYRNNMDAQLGFRYKPSSDWGQGGPLLEQHGISVGWSEDGRSQGTLKRTIGGDMRRYHDEYGPNILVAAMRCLVSSIMGKEIALPEELF